MAEISALGRPILDVINALEDGRTLTQEDVDRIAAISGILERLDAVESALTAPADPEPDPESPAPDPVEEPADPEPAAEEPITEPVAEPDATDPAEDPAPVDPTEDPNT